MQPLFKIDYEKDYAVLSVARKLDLGCIAEFMANWKDVIQRGQTRIILDLRQVSLLDSSGIGAIVTLRNAMIQSNGKLVIVNGSNNICKVFEIAGLKAKLDIADDMEEAVERVLSGL